MSTNVPPHNLRELCDALILLVRSPEATVDDLMDLLPGPDFPTGGFIYGLRGIRDAYTTGRGLLRIRARTIVERERAHGPRGHRRHRGALRRQQGPAARGDRRPGPRQEARGNLRPARRVRPRGPSGGPRVEEGGGAAHRPQPTVQAHAHGGRLRREPPRDRRQPAARAHAQGDPRATSSSTGARSRCARPSSGSGRRGSGPTCSRASRSRWTTWTRVIALIRSSPNPAAAREGLMEQFGLSDAQVEAHPRPAAAPPHRLGAGQDPGRVPGDAPPHRGTRGDPRRRTQGVGTSWWTTSRKSATSTATPAGPRSSS